MVLVIQWKHLLEVNLKNLLTQQCHPLLVYVILIVKLKKDKNFLFSQGWSFLSSSATKIASKATENAVKYGGLASQKVVDISSHVGEKVCFYLFTLFIYLKLLFIYI